MEEAHQDYENRRARVIEDLEIILDTTVNERVKEMIKNAIEFVKEKEI